MISLLIPHTMKILWTFLAGIGAGSVLGLFSAKRKGSEFRKDLFGEWKAGKGGLDVLSKEIGHAYKEAQTGLTDLYNNEGVQKLSDKAKKSLKEQYDKSMTMMKEAKVNLEKKLEEAFDNEQEDEDAKD